MPQVITKDDGTDETVYTQAELDAAKKEADDKAALAIADEKKHTAEKLDEFQKGKTAQELKDIERDNAIKTAKETAEKAVKSANDIVENSRKKSIDFIADRMIGKDVELRKKLD